MAPSSRNAPEQTLSEELQIFIVRWMRNTVNAQFDLFALCLAPSLVHINPQVLEEKPATPTLFHPDTLWLPQKSHKGILLPEETRRIPVSKREGD